MRKYRPEISYKNGSFRYPARCPRYLSLTQSTRGMLTYAAHEGPPSGFSCSSEFGKSTKLDTEPAHESLPLGGLRIYVPGLNDECGSNSTTSTFRARHGVNTDRRTT